MNLRFKSTSFIISDQILLKDSICINYFTALYENVPLQEYSLIYSIDTRKNTFKEMKENKIVEICWHFPLTKE